MIRQGDIYLYKVSVYNLPRNCRIYDDSRAIIAFGEKTGHAHRIVASDQSPMALTWFINAIDDINGFINGTAEASDDVFVQVDRPAQLKHSNVYTGESGDHLPIDLSPGLYQVTRQRTGRRVSVPTYGHNNSAHKLDDWTIIDDIPFFEPAPLPEPDYDDYDDIYGTYGVEGVEIPSSGFWEGVRDFAIGAIEFAIGTVDEPYDIP